MAKLKVGYHSRGMLGCGKGASFFSGPSMAGCLPGRREMGIVPSVPIGIRDYAYWEFGRFESTTGPFANEGSRRLK